MLSSSFAIAASLFALSHAAVRSILDVESTLELTLLFNCSLPTSLESQRSEMLVLKMLEISELFRNLAQLILLP